PDALFNDPYARKLGGSHGEAIVRHMPNGAGTAWPMIVRTAVMDEIIMRSVADGATVVMNVAAGLDARAYRLQLPPTLTWFHVDFPDVVDYVKGQLAGETPRCRLEYASADMTNDEERKAVFARAAAAAHGGWVLVIAEGLLVYLEREEVAGLARALHAPPSFRRWLIDLASPKLLEWLGKSWGRKLQSGNAPMKFGPAEGTAFFEPHGWREVEFRSTWDEALRLKRTMRGAWLWKLLSKLQPAAKREEGRRMSGIVLLERTSS
ncbi:MAG: class I SAM-dependent methyltransferase, partial [Gemmatimonadales bacterium]